MDRRFKLRISAVTRAVFARDLIDLPGDMLRVRLRSGRRPRRSVRDSKPHVSRCRLRERVMANPSLPDFSLDRPVDRGRQRPSFRCHLVSAVLRVVSGGSFGRATGTWFALSTFRTRSLRNSLTCGARHVLRTNFSGMQVRSRSNSHSGVHSGRSARSRQNLRTRYQATLLGLRALKRRCDFRGVEGPRL